MVSFVLSENFTLLLNHDEVLLTDSVFPTGEDLVPESSHKMEEAEPWTRH